MEPSTSRQGIVPIEEETGFDLKKLKQIQLEMNLARLHPAVRQRANALLNLQKEATNLKAECQRLVFELQCDFQSNYNEVYNKREEIINGLYEPKDEECQYGDFEMGEVIPDHEEEVPAGIPKFWLTVLKNVCCVNRMIESRDEGVLEYLADIRCVLQSEPEHSFVIEFQFKPNPYFSNSVLTKTYFLNCEPDEDDPLEFEAIEICKTVGCEILWNDGFNVTKKQTEGEPLDDAVKVNSFFDFFNPPERNSEVSHEGYFLEDFLEMDFEIGNHLRERVIPYAAFYFTGEIEEYSDEDSDTNIGMHVANLNIVNIELEGEERVDQ